MSSSIASGASTAAIVAHAHLYYDAGHASRSALGPRGSKGVHAPLLHRLVSNMARWHATRTKIQLKLAIQRSRMLQEKKAALHKKVRLEIAELVERQKLESARVKTESLIMDDIHRSLLHI